MEKILDKLNKLKDKKYASFQAKLIPTIDSKTIIGVRTPKLRNLAKELIKQEGNDKKDVEKFLQKLPHKYFDENQLHAFLISEIKDFDICIKRIDEFLPYIDNWATCDQLSPQCFRKNKNELLKCIKVWIKSKKSYTIRFAIGMLMQHFLDKDFDKKYLEMVSNVKYKSSKTNHQSAKAINISIDPDKYYVEMMCAWYFATALAKQYNDTLPYIKNHKLDVWTHNKTIQKALESFRVSAKHKEELKKYKLL